MWSGLRGTLVSRTSGAIITPSERLPQNLRLFLEVILISLNVLFSIRAALGGLVFP